MSLWDFLKSLPAFVMFLLILSVPISILAYAGGIYWAISQGMEVEFGDYGLPKRIAQVEPDHIKGCRELREAYDASSNSLADQIRSNSDRISYYEQSISAMQKEYAEALRFDHEQKKLRSYSYTSSTIQREIESTQNKQDEVASIEHHLRNNWSAQYNNLLNMCWKVLQPQP